MKAIPAISVCVPTYRRPVLLERCLRSILAQTFGDFEVVVADNASPDGTADVVSGFSDPRIRYHRNETNIGPFPNMNKAIALANADLICVAHDDDQYLPEFLTQQVELLRSNPSVGMSHSAVYEVDGAGKRRRIVRAYGTTRVLEGRAEFVRFLRGHNVCCSSVVARRALYERAGGFDPRYNAADFALWLRFALLGDVGYIAEPLVEMRVHQERFTNEVSPSVWHDEFVAIMEDGIRLASEATPRVELRLQEVHRAGAAAQGRRFLVAAIAASAHGDLPLAAGYADSVYRLRALGLPWPYAAAARIAATPLGRALARIALVVRGILYRRLR